MPTILRVGPYRFFFYAGDYDEPIHVHVERDDKIAKYWLEPIRLESSGGFNRLDLSRIFSFHPEMALLCDLCVNLRDFLCDIQCVCLRAIP